MSISMSFELNIDCIKIYYEWTLINKEIIEIKFILILFQRKSLKIFVYVMPRAKMVKENLCSICTCMSVALYNKWREGKLIN